MEDSNVKKKVNAILLIITAICAVLLLMACKLSDGEDAPSFEGESHLGEPQPTVSAQENSTLSTLLNLGSLPNLQTAQQIREGMVYEDVLELMGLPIDVRPVFPVQDGWTSWTNVWLFMDAEGHVEVIYKTKRGSNEPAIVDEIIFELSMQARNPSRPITGDAGDVELAVISYQREEYHDWLGEFKEFYRITCELINPNPFGIKMDRFRGGVFFNGEELFFDDISFEDFWDPSAKANSAETGSLRLYRMIEDGDVLEIKGELFHSDFHRVMGNAVYTIRFSGGSTEVENDVTMFTEMYATAGDNVSFKPIGYTQEDEYVRVFIDVVNSNSFNINTRDIAVHYNGVELPLLDWSTGGAFASAGSTIETDFCFYRTAVQGDRVVVRGNIADHHSPLDTFEFEIVFP
jgi:hypothetical protein